MILRTCIFVHLIFCCISIADLMTWRMWAQISASATVLVKFHLQILCSLSRRCLHKTTRSGSAVLFRESKYSLTLPANRSIVACTYTLLLEVYKRALQMFPPSSATAGGALWGCRTKTQERSHSFTRKSGEAIQKSAHQIFVSLLKIHRCLDFQELTVSGSNLLSFFIFLAWFLCFPASWTVKQLTGIQVQAGLSLESFLFMNKHAAWGATGLFTRISLKVFEIFNQSDSLPQSQRNKCVILNWMFF